MSHRDSIHALAVVAIVACMATIGAAKTKPAKPIASPPKHLKAYQSRYYIIHTDLGDDAAAEASARMTAGKNIFFRPQKTRLPVARSVA